MSVSNTSTLARFARDVNDAKHGNWVAMIRRDDRNDWLLISQVDHAHLAAEVAQVWGNDHIPALPLPSHLIPAIRDHDEGWRDWECRPEVDPETGTPRDFTEMPMAVATEIWLQSIAASARGEASQAAALKRYQEYVSERNETLTGDRAATLESMSQFRASFRRDEARRCAALAEVPGVAFESSFDELIEAGIVRSLGDDLVGAYHALDPASMGASPLGGLWVGSHFCYLAEKAREGRLDHPDELTAIDRFLGTQETQREEWTDDSLRDFAGDELQRLIETGYRYVQFFDRMSLWLCCAERTKATEMTLPGGKSFQLTPIDDNQIRIDPFPLNVPSLELTVDVRRIPAKEYADGEQLQTAITASNVESLEWTLRS